MADNTAKARKEIDGWRANIARHVEKFKRYSDPNDKAFALKTIQRDQASISTTKGKHPSLRISSWQDSWRP